MNVLVWIAPGTWPAVVAAARERPPQDLLNLVAVADSHDAAPLGALGALMGRAGPAPESQARAVTGAQARAILDQATAALGRPCRAQVVAGRTEREITAAARDVDWLIMARDGDRSRVGPGSLGRHARFVLDHAPCTVQLIWPEGVPQLATIPPIPPPGVPPAPTSPGGQASPGMG